jgi:hypothetical protein
MARRVLKPLTPVLVTLVAVILGFLTIGPSFAGPGGVIGEDGGGGPKSGTSSTAPLSPSPAAPAAPNPPAASATPSPSASASTAPVNPPEKAEATEGPKDCASCMLPPPD